MIISLYARGITTRWISDQRNELYGFECNESFISDVTDKILQEVSEKWEEKYPNAVKSWRENWDVLSPILKFSSDVRKVIYTINAIESLNSTYKRLNRQRRVFPSDKALLHCTLRRLKRRRCGQFRFGTKGRFLENFRLCMREDFQ